MATQRCDEKCVYYEAGPICARCGNPRVLHLRQTPAEGLEIIEVKLQVVEPLSGKTYRFTASVEDEGILFCTDYDGDEDGELRNEEAWAALDCRLGLNVREAAVDSGIGSGSPFALGQPVVSFAILPYDMAILVREALSTCW